MIEADTKYDCTIEEAEMDSSLTKGTPCIRFLLRTPAEDSIVYQMWLTAGTRPRVAKTLQEFGIEKQTLASSEFWADPGKFLEGKKGSFVTELDTYGKTPQVKVKWFNGTVRVKNTPSTSVAEELAASFMDPMDIPF